MKTRLPYKGRTGRRSPSERLRPHLLQRFPCPLTRIADNNSGSLAHQGKKNRASLSTEKRSAPSERLRGHLLTGVQTRIFNWYFNTASVHNLCISVQLFNSWPRMKSIPCQVGPPRIQLLVTARGTPRTVYLQGWHPSLELHPSPGPGGGI